MYGFPSDFDPNVFVSKTLDWIAFGKFVVRFDFGPDLSVTTEASFSVKLEAAGPENTYACPAESADFFALLGQSVTAVNAESDGTLVLIFDSGATLTFRDEFTQFESYMIRFMNFEFII